MKKTSNWVMVTRLATTVWVSPAPPLPLLLRAAAHKKSNRKDTDAKPPRITSNVKQNLQFLKLLKEFQRESSGSPKPLTRYRRKIKKKEELPSDDELYEDPTTTLYHTNQGFDLAVPVLLVDGYNVCGYWPKLKKHFSKGRLDIARQKLIDELIVFSAIKGVKVVVVFDAMMSDLPTHKETFVNVDIIFATDASADAWIEKEGAYIWSCKALISEIKDSKTECEQLLLEQRSYSKQGQLLEHNLNPEVVDALRDLKRKLEESEKG